MEELVYEVREDGLALCNLPCLRELPGLRVIDLFIQTLEVGPSMVKGGIELKSIHGVSVSRGKIGILHYEIEVILRSENRETLDEIAEVVC